MKVLLTYFKLTGKFYASGEYETTLKDLGEIWNEVSEMLNPGRLPGLIEGHSQFFVTVNVPDHEYNHPHLVMSDDLRDRMKTYESVDGIFRSMIPSVAKSGEPDAD